MMNKAEIRDKLNPNYTSHGECIQRTTHNVVTYERLPSNYVVLFDIQRKDGTKLTPDGHIVLDWKVHVSSLNFISNPMV